MFCNQCGKPLPDGAMFCPECGAVRETENDITQKEVKKEEQQIQPAQASVPTQNMAFNPVPMENKEKPKKKGFPLKVLVPCALVFAVLVAVLVIFLTGGRKTGMDTYADTGDYVYYFGSFEKGAYDDEEDIAFLSGAGNGEKSIWVYYDGNALYYMRSDLEPKLIIEESVSSCVVSYTGEYIAYVEGNSTEEGDLYLYCVKDGKITQVDTDVYPGYLCLSPEGKAVAYLKDYESYLENDLYVGGIGIKNQKVDDDGSLPVAISNNGKTFYYIDDSSKLYIYNGKDSSKVSSSGCYNFVVNKDVTEILYVKDGKTYYHTPKMEDPVKISNEEMDGVCLPDNVVGPFWISGGTAALAGVKSFKGGVLSMYGDGLYWFNDKGTDTIKICSSDNVKLSADGKSILFIKSGDLYRIKKIGENMEAELLYDEAYVDYVVASDDLSRIYIVVDEELLYLKGKNKTERITNDLSYFDDVAYNEDMKKIFFIENDSLCYADKNAKSKVRVMEDVYVVERILNMIVFVKDDGDTDAYYYMNGKEPVYLYED